MTDARSTAEARHRAYSLVGRLLVEGLTLDSRPIVRALPALDAAVSREDPDVWAVEHQRAMAREVFPYESVFLSPEALLGGPIAGSVRESYASSGLTGSRLDVEPDHLGLELAHMAHLCAAERDALADAHESVERIRALQREFLGEHLLVWAPGVLATLIQGPSELARQVAVLAAQVLADHAADLGAAAERWPMPGGDPLADPKTRLRDLAVHLLTPAHSGWFLGREALGGVAQRADLPSGFGPRKKLLEGLLFAGADHRRAPELIAELQALTTAWDATYSQLEDLGLDVGAWRTRLHRTRDLLQRMAAAISS